MDEESRNICGSVSVDIQNEVLFGFPRRREVYIEPPVEIRRGTYDIDLIGAFTYLGGRETFMRHISSVGRFCSIASNVVSGQIEHPTNSLSAHPLFEGGFNWFQLTDFKNENAEMIRKAREVAHDRLTERNRKIVIGNDVWIGEGAFIRRGIEIGDGAIVASRAVVTQDVPSYAIVGGSPARIIRMRFDEAIIAELLRLQWWTYGLSALGGVDFTDVEAAVTAIDRNIEAGRAEPYVPVYLRVSPDNTAGLYTYDFDWGEFRPI